MADVWYIAINSDLYRLYWYKLTNDYFKIPPVLHSQHKI